MFLKKNQPDESIRPRLIRRLRSTTDTELVRWIDNIHTGLGTNISELRKSLSRSNKEQASVYTEDIRTGAVSLLAAIQVLEERFVQD